jgi:hypothetical protein
MTRKVGEATPEPRFLRVLHQAAAVALVAGAAGSVGLLLHAGQRINSPRLLMGLFALWVLSPFVLFVVADVVSNEWSAITRATLYGVILVVTISSLAIYAVVALGPSPPKAPAFVLVPPVSCLLMSIAVPIAAFVSRRSSR